MWIYALIAVMVATVVVAVLKRKMAAQHLAERRNRARMIRHADEEHALVLQGRLTGVYGAFQVPPELRGVGFPWAR